MPTSTFKAVASLLLLTYGAAVLGTMAPHYSPFDIGLIWYGSAVFWGMLFLGASRQLTKGLKNIAAHPRQSLAVVGMGTGDGLCWFFGIILIGLSGLSVVGRLGLVVLLAYSLLILKEKHSKTEIALMCAMIGASFLFLGGLHLPHQYLGYTIAVLGTFFSAGYVIAKKHGAASINGMAPHMLRSLCIWLCLILLSLFMNDGAFPPQGMPLTDFLLIASGGLTNATLGQYFRMSAFKDGENLSTVTMIMSVSPVLIFAYGILILHEPGNALTWTAAGIMLFASLALSRVKAKRAKFAKG